MQIQTTKQKMSNLEVIQRVLDFWDPLGASLYRGGSLGQIDEYDDYSLHILELLQGKASESEIANCLNHIRFQAIGLNRDDNAEAENRFYSWALIQTWFRQQSSESNLRLKTASNQQVAPEEKRSVSRLEILQQAIQDWDPLEHSKYWLYGADTLNKYDEAGICLESAIADGDLKEICIALELARTSESDRIGFCLEHRSLNDALQRAFDDHIANQSARNEEFARSLMSTFSHWNRSLARRVKPRAR